MQWVECDIWVDFVKKFLIGSYLIHTSHKLNIWTLWIENDVFYSVNQEHCPFIYSSFIGRPSNIIRTKLSDQREKKSIIIWEYFCTLNSEEVP